MGSKSIGLCPQGLESPRCRSPLATAAAALRLQSASAAERSPLLPIFAPRAHAHRCVSNGGVSSDALDQLLRHNVWCSTHMTLCPSGQGDGLEIHWALPAGARIPSVSQRAADTPNRLLVAAAPLTCDGSPNMADRPANRVFGAADTCRGAPDTVPERSRGWTRNPLGSARRSSNPLGVAETC